MPEGNSPSVEDVGHAHSGGNMDDALPRAAARQRIFAKCAACLAIVVGATGLAGVVLHAPILRTVVPGQIPIRENTCLGFLLLAASLLLQAGTPRKRCGSLAEQLAKACAAAVALLGIASLSELLIGWNLHIDQLVLAEPMQEAVRGLRPGLMSPVTATAFVLLGCALFVLPAKSRRGAWLGQIISLAAMLVSVFGVLDVLLDYPANAAHIAVQTSVALLFVSSALVGLRTEVGIGALLVAHSTAGTMARRLLPAAFYVPVVMGLLRWFGARAGLFSDSIGLSLMVTGIITLLLAIVGTTTTFIERAEKARQAEAAQREAATQTLQASEQRYRSLVTATTQIAWTTDSQGRVDDMPQWRELTGQTVEEVRGWRWLNALHPDDRARANEIWSQAVKKRALYDSEYRVRRRDGEYRYLAARGVPVLNDDGSVLEWVGTCNDITERKQAEEAIRRANAYNRSLLEASLDPLVTIGPDGKITDVNAATEAVTGCVRAALIGTDFSDYFTEPEKARGGYQQVFREGLVRDYPLELRHRDGQITSVIYNASVYRDEGGAVIGVFAAARDISARKRAEQALHRANAYNRSLLETSLDPLVTIGPNGKITDVNAATEAATGCARNVLIGTDFSDYFTDPGRARAGYQRAFREGLVRDYPLEVRHRDGRTISVLYNASLYRDENGKVIGLFAAARDITERKRAEEALAKLNAELEQRVIARTAELAASNKELEAFTYSVSHDLRAPLRHVDGFSKILLERYGEQFDTSGRHYLQEIRAGARNMGRLVDELLELSRIGRQEPQLQVAGLNSVFEEARVELMKDAGDRQIEWRIATLPFVECDPTLMRQAITNLLSNALKFTRQCDPAVIEVGTVERDNETVVFVRDNGVGFDMKYAEKLFGVFQRLHRSEDFDGTGVGLATVKRIIDKHGGRVWAEAELNKGATFYFVVGASQARRTNEKSMSAAGGKNA